MPLIRPRTRRIRVFRHISRLQEPNRDVLLAYAKFINETPDYVLNQLIETTLARDRDFVSWRAGQGDGPVSGGRTAGDADLSSADAESGTR